MEKLINVNKMRFIYLSSYKLINKTMIFVDQFFLCLYYELFKLYMIDLSHFVSQDEIYHWMIEILRDQKDLFVKLLRN